MAPDCPRPLPGNLMRRPLSLLALGGILAIITGIGLVIVSRRNTLAELAN